MIRRTAGKSRDEATVPVTAAAFRAFKRLRTLTAAALAFAFASPLPSFAADPNPGNNSGGFKVRILPNDVFPPAKITDLTGLASGVAGDVLLQWTAPQESSGTVNKPVPVDSYDLRTATFSIADVGGSTTAWFAAAATVTTPVPALPSTLQASLTTLEVATTYYFAIKSLDDAGFFSDLDEKALLPGQQVAVGVRGIQGVTNLTAVTGSGAGEIDLSWTAPGVITNSLPLFYDFRASTITNIPDDAAFTLADPLIRYSSSTVPGAGSPGDAHAFTVTGLTPAVTYYFAVRESDSGVPYTGVWLSSAALDINAFNFARAGWVPQPPEAITNLSAVPGTGAARIALSWTAPENLNGVPIERYIVKVNTNSVFDVGSDTTAWWNRTDSTSAFLVDGSLPGTALSIEVPSLNSSLEYFAGIKSVDITGVESDIDTKSLAVIQQAKAFPRPTPPIINLTATPGTASGSIRLEWTIPADPGLIDPRTYEVRASSQANIDNEFEYEAAQPLTAFSGSTPPTAGVPGGVQFFTVTGLHPLTTYYFAMRIQDSNTPPVQSIWERDFGNNINVNNWSVPAFIENPPQAITDLTALMGDVRGEVELSWTAPLNQNFVEISSYTIYAATYSVTEFAGDAAAWEASASSQVYYPAAVPGALETFTWAGLEAGFEHFFSIRSTDELGEISPTDTATQNAFNQITAPARGVGDVKDLSVQGGPSAGTIDLIWTTPRHAGAQSPFKYDIRASTTGNIADDTAFAAARPVTAFSETQPPSYTLPGLSAAIRLTGLAPFTTYYFAMRVDDSSATPNTGSWLRDAALERNTTNFASSTFIRRPPTPITDLTALAGVSTGRVELAWTAPENPNFVPVSSYTVAFATFPISELANDATAWFTAASSQVVVAPAQTPGALETLSLTGLEPGLEYFFAVKSIDETGEVSAIDDLAAIDKPGTQGSVRAYGIQRITDLFAATNGGSGAIDLSWTAPHRSGVLGPEIYEIAVSSVANIDTQADFQAALPLTAFSPTAVPALAAGGAAETLQVVGLEPLATYYFAIRVADSSSPARNEGVWLRQPALGRNTTNYARSSFFPNPPDPVTDLTALAAGSQGRIDLSWTAPANANLIPISSYTVAFATFSIAELGNDATAWFTLASSQVVVAPAQTPGAVESLSVTGLEPGLEYFFAVRSYDLLGEVSPVDDRAAPDKLADQTRERAYGIARVTDLVAVTNGGSGAIDLSWTAPHRAGVLDPVSYLIKASSAANIAGDAAFAAAQPLSAFSPTLAPAVGAGGTAEALVQNAGVWERVGSENQANFASASFFANPPEPITDLTALQGSVEGEIRLEWTAPFNRNLIPITSYEIRYAQTPVTDAPFLGNTTAWFDAGTLVTVPVAQSSGALETTTLSSLFPNDTLIDALGEAGHIDLGTHNGVQASTMPANFAPATPTGLATVNGTLRVSLSWDELPDGLAGKGLDFAHYRLERSLDDTVFVDVTTVAALGYTDIPLSAFTSYYYRISAVDQAGNTSAPSASVTSLPETLVPMEPFGLTFTRTGSSVTVTWGETRLFGDRSAFVNVPPTGDELSGYLVMRSTDPVVNFSIIQALPIGTTQHTIFDLDGDKYYRITSYNDHFTSTSPVVITPAGDQLVYTADNVSRLDVTEGVLFTLQDPSGDPEKAIRIEAKTVTGENTSEILNTVEFLPLRGGTELVENFHFPQPVEIAIRYDTTGSGTPTPVLGLNAEGATGAATKGEAMALNGGHAVASLGTASLAPQAAANEQNLGVFWHNGVEYKKLYGKINTQNQTIQVKTPNIGKFQVRSQFRSQSATFDLSNITTRVITPNGDGRNDFAIMIFDNPNGSSVTGKIYDLRGAFVADMAAGPQPDSLQWDGKMNGSVVTSGVYVYQVKGDGKTFNGTFVVAR
jgi:gliding motility-associated-like protein